MPTEPFTAPASDAAFRRELAAFIDHSVEMTEYVKELYETILQQQTAINTLLTVCSTLQEQNAARAKENAAIVTMIAGLAATKGSRA